MTLCYYVSKEVMYMNEDYEKLKAMIDKKNSVYVVHGEQVVNE